MRRKLTFAVLLALSAANSQALALGVGEVDVRSSLNAPLRAVIPLTDTGGLDPELLRVSVADPREFESAGLLRTPLAASVRADVEVRQGEWVVTLASERAVREPWMDLLLRFDWPSGRQLREITLLLDPPGYDNMPVLVSGSSRRPASATSPGAAEHEEAETEVVASRPAETSAGRQPQAESRAWIGSGDTLWSVAGRLRPDSGISMNQMMVALVEANPDIFPSGNINAMRAGHSLVVPARDAIATRSADEAARIVQAMNQAWASRGSEAPRRVPLGPSVATGEGDEVVAAPAARAVAEPSTITDDTGTLDQGGAVLAVATEEAGSTPRLTLLSDEELAAENATEGRADRVDESEEGVSVGEAGQSDDTLDADTLATLGAGELALEQADPRLALLERRWQESRVALEEVQAERDALQQELGGLRDEVEAMREQLAVLLADGTGTEGGGVGRVVVQSDADAQGDASWWGGAMYPASLDRNLVVGGAGLVALLGLWLWVRRRQRRDADAAMGSAAMPSMIHGMPTSAVTIPSSASSATMPPMVAGMTVETGEPQQDEAPRPTMPQAEAISEADIFMAYGRYDQARELLQASLDRDPERHDLRLKLLNVHVEQGNWQSAEETMQTLAETGDSGVLAEAARLMARQQARPSGAVEEAAERQTPETGAYPAYGEARANDEATDNPEHEAFPEIASDSPTAGAGHDVEAPAEKAQRREAVPGATLDYASFPSFMGDDSGARPAAPPELGEAKRSAPPANDPMPEPPSRPMQKEARVEWDVIDYQPPPLDPKPAPRTETPMQPSIDFPLVGEGDGQPEEAEPVASASGAAADNKEVEWEVEEVAFPPLDPDNGAGPEMPAQPDDLADARRLLESGEVERARALLQRVLEGAEAPRLRDEAQALITHYRL
ncbi:FimV/HubP family polar landmark protein [Billgrantia sp. LNSP4103-1]|uniref:FimV/HubP family polar landmark protein n=1 Tax=Billgrantia sp. LNSP4103-1 TaxID=3410266 RepID=UPI00403FC07C